MSNYCLVNINMKKETWIITISVIIFAILSGIKSGINNAEKEEVLDEYLSNYYDRTTSDGRIEKIEAYAKPKTWRDYEIGNAFTISIPPTLELRQDADPYSKALKELHAKGIRVNISSDKIVFQQKGLSIRNPEALSTYSRIIMSIERGEKGDFPCSTEFEELDIVTVKEFQKMARVATISSGYEVKGFIDVGWKNYDGTYALEISYTRTGEAGKNTNVKTCCLFNDDKMAEITLSYRKEDAGKWEKDLSNVIRTFKWK